MRGEARKHSKEEAKIKVRQKKKRKRRGKSPEKMVGKKCRESM